MRDRPFAIATVDEVWLGGRLIERRFDCGDAHQSGREIRAASRIDASLAAVAEDSAKRLRSHARTLVEARARIVVRAIRDREQVTIEDAMSISIGDAAVVTDGGHFDDDLPLLRSAVAPPIEIAEPPRLPMVWRNGSASILFHEAAGHAAENASSPIEWPSWLRVRDVSPGGDADLLAGELPRAMRRSSFRDVPLPRMTRLYATQSGAPSEIPDPRIEVVLVAHGSFDPIDDVVSLVIAVSTLVEGVKELRIAPFAISISRRAIAKSLSGAIGHPLRYPGVICSSEGQELLVHSFAPVVVTSEMA